MTRKHRILVIDDDPGLLKMIGLVLHRAGYEVAVAESGLEGLEKVDKFKPDLVILDRMMPLLDGLEVCRRLRSRPATLQLPVIILSALGEVDSKIEGFEAGADDYVAKPVEPKELLARTKALLKRSQYTRPRGARTVAFVGAKGGVGVSTVAVNVAASLLGQGKTVILAELRKSGGTIRYQLKTSSDQDLSDLLQMDPTQIKRREVERRVIKHSSGLLLLLAPYFNGSHDLTSGHVEAVLSALTPRADYVLLDLSPELDEGAHRVLELSDQILLITEPEMLSVSCARGQLTVLREWEVYERVDLVIVARTPSSSWLNRVEVENRLGMGGGEAEAASRWEPRALEVDVRLRQGVAGVIPSAPELLHESVRNGVPLVLIEPSAPTARALTDLTGWLVEKDPTETPPEEPVKYVA